jgi:hypothetical protein
MNNRFLSTAAALILSATAVTAWAQEESNILRYSQLSPQGTARSMGFGGALGSVGGDFSSLSVNPAGIGMYRKGEMMFTPSVKINSTSGTYLGTTTSDDVSRFNVNNFGMVFTSAPKGKRYEKSKWKSTSFGVGFNRLADYNRTYTYSGFNSGPNSSSVSELFVAAADANEIQFADNMSYLGYESYLINQDPNTGAFYTVVPWQSGINQGRMVTERGRYNEWAISLGGNYMEKLLLGATVGIPSIRYERRSDISESTTSADPQTNPYNFQSLVFSEDVRQRGTGLNLKLGFIYKATDNFRFGAAVHTPTWFNITEEYTPQVSAIAQGQNLVVGWDPPTSISNYTLTTPWRGIVSATGMLGKYGFVTADYEFVGYNTARFATDFAADERFLNNYARTQYKGASNIRVGAEGRPSDFILLRLGFGYYGSPYKNAAVNGDRIDISAGLGFRFQQWFIDFGYVNSSYKETEQPYQLPYAGVIVPTATLKQTRNNAALTIGFKF